MRPKREPVPTPEDAAQVVMHRGRPVIVFEKQIIPPISFYAAADSDEKFKTVLEQIQLASEGGVHLFSILVNLQIDSTGVKKAVDEVLPRLPEDRLRVFDEGLAKRSNRLMPPLPC